MSTPLYLPSRLLWALGVGETSAFVESRSSHYISDPAVLLWRLLSYLQALFRTGQRHSCRPALVIDSAHAGLSRGKVVRILTTQEGSSPSLFV